MVETKDKSIKILIWCYLTQKSTFIFLVSLLLEARAKNVKKFRWFFGQWKNKMICFRNLLTFMPFRKNRGKLLSKWQQEPYTNTQFTHAMQIMLCLHICVEHVADWCRKVHQKCTLLQHDAVSTCLFCTSLT